MGEPISLALADVRALLETPYGRRITLRGENREGGPVTGVRFGASALAPLARSPR